MNLHISRAVIVAVLPLVALAAPARAGAVSPLYDPAQLPQVEGVVRQFTLTPRGDIDGFVLVDGTEVKTPPHLSTELAYAVRPGDSVTVHGLKAAALPLVEAASVMDARTGQTVVDNGPPRVGRAPPPPPDAAGEQAMTVVQGRIVLPLHGPKGDVNGALLEDGTILRLPPPEAERLQGDLGAGRSVAARGVELKTALGAVVDVRAFGASVDALAPLDAAPPPPPPPRG